MPHHLYCVNALPGKTHILLIYNIDAVRMCNNNLLFTQSNLVPIPRMLTYSQQSWTKM